MVRVETGTGLELGAKVAPQHRAGRPAQTDVEVLVTTTRTERAAEVTRALSRSMRFGSDTPSSRWTITLANKSASALRRRAIAGTSTVPTQ